MAVTPQGTAPYSPSTTIIGTIRRYRDKGLPSPIDGDVLQRAGVVSETLVPRTLQSLQILELIDEAGNPTPVFKKMRSVPEADFKACLADWLRSVYADVFAYVDPAKDTPTQVRDAFRGYVPHGQQDRMVSLFLTLCGEAGLVPENKKSEPKLSARKQYKVHSGVPLPPKRNPVRSVPPTPTNLGGLAPALAGILQSIPSPQQGWTQEARDKFVSTFGTVLDFVVPIKAEDELREEDES